VLSAAQTTGELGIERPAEATEEMAEVEDVLERLGEMAERGVEKPGLIPSETPRRALRLSFHNRYQLSFTMGLVKRAAKSMTLSI